MPNEEASKPRAQHSIVNRSLSETVLQLRAFDAFRRRSVTEKVDKQKVSMVVLPLCFVAALSQTSGNVFVLTSFDHADFYLDNTKSL